MLLVGSSSPIDRITRRGYKLRPSNGFNTLQWSTHLRLLRRTDRLSVFVEGLCSVPASLMKLFPQWRWNTAPQSKTEKKLFVVPEISRMASSIEHTLDLVSVSLHPIRGNTKCLPVKLSGLAGDVGWALHLHPYFLPHSLWAR